MNEKNSFAGIPATGGAGGSLVTPGSKVAPSGRRRRGCRGGKSGSWSTWPHHGRRRDWPRRPPPGRQITGLWLIQRPHGEKDPQGLHVEGVAGPLGDAVVVAAGSPALA